MNVEYYKGDLVNGKREGEGQFYIDGKLIYNGEWKNNVYHGTGRLNYLRRGYYIGSFYYGYQHGFGVEYNDNNTIIYEGFWNKGMSHGKGRINYIDGGEYNGDFYYGNRTGNGREYDRYNKIKYNGQWLNGLYHGKGALYSNNRLVYKGNFHKGNRHGYGQEIFSNGVKNGYWIAGKRITILTIQDRAVSEDEDPSGYFRRPPRCHFKI